VIYVVASLAVAVFMLAFVLLRIVNVAMNALDTTRGVIKTLSSPDLDDSHREAAMQAASLSLLGSFVSITLRGVVALLMSFLVIYLADVMRIAGKQDVIELLSSTEAIVATTVILTAAWLIWKRW
jgi:hypothetical protein